MLTGSILLYALTKSDVELITGRRTSPESIRNRLGRNPPEWPAGAQAHVGEPVMEGDLVPMIVTRDQSSDTERRVGGQVFLNGSDTYWVPAVRVATETLPRPGEAVALTDLQGLQVLGEASSSRGR
jgi:hypothetical protein